MKNSQPDRPPEERSAELGRVLPYPYHELFPLHHRAPLASAPTIGRDVFEVLLTQAEALAWVCQAALASEDILGVANHVAVTLGVLAEYLTAMQMIYGFTKEL